MTRHLLINRNTTTIGCVDDLMEVVNDIDVVDTEKTVLKTTSTYNMHRKTIKPSNRQDINRIFKRETFLIFNN